MKCSNCGFTYDDEKVCPICGTPAQNAPSAPENNPYSAPAAPPAEAPVPPEPPRHEPPAPKKRSKGMMIALVCGVSVIAACMLVNTVTSIVTSISRAEKDKKRDKTIDRVTDVVNDLLDLYDSADKLGLLNDVFSGATSDEGFFGMSKDASGELINSDESIDMMAHDTITDNKTHAIGESCDLGKGTLTLKSAAVSQTASNYDSNLQQVKFTVEITNTGDKAQSYSYPYFTINDEAFDESHYAFTEYRNDDPTSTSPGETLTAFIYYNLPKNSADLNCKVAFFGSEGESYYEASTNYAFNAQDVK